MRPLDAVHAGYDEVTHINFVMMQAMPQDVVDHANTEERLVGPAKFGKDVTSMPSRSQAFSPNSFEARHDRRSDAGRFGSREDSDGSAISPDYAPYADIAPPAVARSFKAGGFPL